MYQREASSVLKVPLQEISEDYLGVAPIRSGDSVIILREVLVRRSFISLRTGQAGWNREQSSLTFFA